jgi:multidrug transporter EmrE-like cation transporter
MYSVDFIANYFSEEKIERLFFIIIGSITIAAALVFLGIIKYSFFKGLAYPLLLVGLIQLIIGINVYNRSPKDQERVTRFIMQEPDNIKTEELPRMEIVMQNFTIYKWIEIILIITGIVLISLFYKSPQTFWKGLGLGLLIQAVLMLCLDVMAEHRAEIYIQALKAISV